MDVLACAATRSRTPLHLKCEAEDYLVTQRHYQQAAITMGMGKRLPLDDDEDLGVMEHLGSLLIRRVPR